MDRARVIEKIAKCFALARSKGATSNEAETALRQGRWLMEQYNLEERDVRASLATEACVLTGTRRSPAAWLHSLARTCGQAFDCDYLAFTRSSGSYSFKFVGMGVSPELAAYAYSALHQQLLSARRDHVSGLKRCNLATKRRRGQLFAESWISAVAATVQRFAGHQSVEATQAIEAYIQIHHPNLQLKEFKATPVKGYDIRSQEKGWALGAEAYLHRGVSTVTDQRFLGAER